MKIRYDEFCLERVDINNLEHLKYIKKLMKTRDIQNELFISLEQFENSKDSIQTGSGYIAVFDEEPKVYLEFGPFNNSRVSLSVGVLKCDRGRKYAYKVLSEVLPDIFEKFNLEEVSAIISKTNYKSIGLFEKLGFCKSSDTEEVYKFYKENLIRKIR